MSVVFLARHGQTPWHAENRYTGTSDIPLTATGHEQAERLAAWAAGREIARVLTSPLRRAVDTAAPAARALGVGVDTDERIREVDFGAGEGLTRPEMAEAFGDELAAFLAAPAHHPLPGGERGVDAVARAWPALRELGAPDAPVTLLVGHSTLLRLLLCRMLGIPLDDYRRRLPALHNTAVTTVDLHADQAALLEFNTPLAS